MISVVISQTANSKSVRFYNHSELELFLNKHFDPTAFRSEIIYHTNRKPRIKAPCKLRALETRYNTRFAGCPQRMIKVFGANLRTAVR